MEKLRNQSPSDFPVTSPKRGRLIAAFPIFEKIVSWKRPGKGRKGHRYQPKSGLIPFMNGLDRYERVEIPGVVIVDWYFFFRRPKNPLHKFPVGKSYGDEDNLRKAGNDALQDLGFISDDRFIIGGEQFKQYATEDYVVLKIYSVREM